MKKIIYTFLLIMTISVVVVGCSSNNSNKNDDESRKIKFLTEDTADQKNAKVFSLEDEDIPETELDIETIEQNDLLQQISLLSGNDDLPELFDYETNQLGDLMDSGQLLDIEETFKDLEIYDELDPSAVELVEQLTDDRGLYAIPVELNIEGFWFNKEIFEKYNLEVPETWEELMQVSETLNAEGVQPFSLSGEERWPITRMINAFAIRYYGPDAMEKVDNEELSITDDGFVKAAKTVQDMNENEYFGKGVNTIDSDTSLDMFLQGDTAMFYSGSWNIGDFNDEDRNDIGIDSIGLFSIPLVEGGEGELTEWPMNTGLTISASENKYDEQMGEWMKEVFTDYGDKALEETGMITGFKTDETESDTDHLTSLVQEKIEEADDPALWFEGRFNEDQKLTAEENAQLLIEGDMSAEEYLEALDKEL